MSSIFTHTKGPTNNWRLGGKEVIASRFKQAFANLDTRFIHPHNLRFSLDDLVSPFSYVRDENGDMVTVTLVTEAVELIHAQVIGIKLNRLLKQLTAEGLNLSAPLSWLNASPHQFIDFTKKSNGRTARVDATDVEERIYVWCYVVIR